MAEISVCLLTCNSERTLERCLLSLLGLSDDIIVVDSGSTDQTISILNQYGLTPLRRDYDTHSKQMNFAIKQARNDWIFCIDSDELLDETTVNNIQNLKQSLADPTIAYRISRHWFVLGREVRAMYPVSSPDYPVRLFHRQRVRFNDAPVDDKAVGFDSTQIVPGFVRHDTFHSLDEMFRKANEYTTCLVKYKKIKPSLWSAISHPPFALLLWYFRKGGFKDGRIGIVTTAYAGLYTFLKYFKAWYQEKNG